MDNKLHQEAVKSATRAKFRGKKAIKSKTTPRFPESAEREFARVTNGYMKILDDVVKKHLPSIMRAYQKELAGNIREDDAFDAFDKTRQEFQKMAQELERKLSKYGLQSLVEKVARIARKSSYRQWKRACKETLGIDLMDDYYNGDFYEQAIRKWVDENVLKIKSLPTNTLGSMQQIVFDGFRNGESTTDIAADIQHEYQTNRHQAQMLARDQVSTLNSQISRLQQEDAGCKRYKWSTSKDSRVRDCHKSLDGKVFSWDDPPEMWYKTKSGIRYTGRRCNPGQDYMCRCVAIPVFDFESLDVPMQWNGQQEKEASAKWNQKNG